MKTILLCSDLDRTLIPNGGEEESAQARPLFACLASHPQLRLAYVSGRDRQLVKAAITDFDLPEPDFVIGDVGTTPYHVDGNQWRLNQRWQGEIGRIWHGRSHDEITALLAVKLIRDLLVRRFFKLDQSRADDVNALIAAMVKSVSMPIVALLFFPSAWSIRPMLTP
jgi:hydroxymethylpyrimidine pyrophosphatase-like HAD family hydrolase